MSDTSSAVAAGRRRLQSSREEIANAVSHGIGLLAVIVLTPVLLTRALAVGDAAFVVGTSVFCATMVFLYAASTFYHAVPPGRGKRILWLVDHAGILLFIAGSYTPFTLGALEGARGWMLFGIVWALALAGVGLKLAGDRLPRGLSTGLYLVMGWSVLLALDLVLARVAPPGVGWLVAGGVAYTLGVGFFATDDRLRYGHLVWHLFVLAGTACHCVALAGWGAAPSR